VRTAQPAPTCNVDADGRTEYRDELGRLDRFDGPAVIVPGQYEEWWLDGVQTQPRHWLATTPVDSPDALVLDR
jgi:hypothetical protein